MATLDRNGVSIYYEDHGEGPAILLSHGYSATSRMWASQVESLRDEFRVITWDMRGHGQSASPEPPSAYSEEATVEDMAAILDACDVDRAVIGGLSLGGYMSLVFHLTYPARVRALMLFDTGPGFKNKDAQDKWNDRAAQWAAALESKGLAALSEIGSDEMRQDQHRSAGGLAKAALGMLTKHHSRVMESLSEVAVPTLVLVGENDAPFLASAEYMVKKIPNAEKVVLAGAGHAANLHQPEAFNEAVSRFLAALPAT